jgi:ectoine hydroxylase-related dioxygenase (phytanoyl-CoA dioxygenase family)
MITSEQLNGLDEMQRQLLGFNVRVPASMDEYYLPEAERLYKPNQG